MTERTLNAAQVASMLVSTSCGIGFLLGTGELALRQGMAACLYPVATSLGLVALTLCSHLLWTNGQSIWAWFNRLHGPSISHRVALLSLVWMSGVLAAQIRGGTALLVLAGLSPTSALVVIDAALVLLSVMRLSWLSAGFAACMLACNATLVSSLIRTHRIDVWLDAPLQFVNALPQLTPVHTVCTIFSVATMVVCGADYQQFLIAARTPSTARGGCILAAGIVFVIGFLPTSAAIVSAASGPLNHLRDPVQVIPIVLIRTLSEYTTSMTRCLVIIMLASTALGAGSAILRAMSDATSTFGRPSFARPIWSRAMPVVFASLVAWRGQSLVEMMIELNLVYITAVGPLLGLALLKAHVSNRAARSAVTAGCCVAVVCYLLRWSNIATVPEAVSLCIGLPLSLLFALASRTQAEPPPREAIPALVSPRQRSSQTAAPRGAPSSHQTSDNRGR